MRINFSY